jgi:hypothetical protein
MFSRLDNTVYDIIEAMAESVARIESKEMVLELDLFKDETKESTESGS